MALRAFGWTMLSWALLVSPSIGADLKLAKVADSKVDEAFDVEIQAFLTSDYIYRGVSLSARKPSAGASFEAQWHRFYAGINLQSVDLPTQPASELTWTAGYRWPFAGFEFDLGASYFWYPGEILTDGAAATSYWEYAFKAERDLIKDLVTLKTVLGYSPNVSGTGAWGAYSEAGIEIVLPTLRNLPDVEWQLNASAGYWRFGDTSAMLGGLPLPAFTNWHVGLEFTLKKYIILDLSYWDSNLSREDCFVFTGDTMATPGGAVNPVSNPDGLRSRLCGATFVGTLTVRFNLSDVKN